MNSGGETLFHMSWRTDGSVHLNTHQNHWGWRTDRSLTAPPPGNPPPPPPPPNPSILNPKP